MFPSFNSRKLKSSKGFTLMELLIVIALIAILVAIGAASYTQAQKKARNSKRQSDVNKIALSLEEYFSDHHDYPIRLSCLTGNDSGCEPPYDKIYLGNIPTDPLTNTAYTYQPCTIVTVGGANLYENYSIQTDSTNTDAYSYRVTSPNYNC